MVKEKLFRDMNEYIRVLVKSFFHSGLKSKLEINRDRDDVQGLAKEVLTLLLLNGQDWDANTVDLMIEVFTKPFEPVVLTHTFKRGVGQIPITKQASWPSSDSQRKRLEEYLFKMNELVGELDEPTKRFYRKTTGALNDIIDRLGSIQKSQDDLALANSYH